MPTTRKSRPRLTARPISRAAVVRFLLAAAMSVAVMIVANWDEQITVSTWEPGCAAPNDPTVSCQFEMTTVAAVFYLVNGALLVVFWILLATQTNEITAGLFAGSAGYVLVVIILPAFWALMLAAPAS